MIWEDLLISMLYHGMYCTGSVMYVTEAKYIFCNLISFIYYRKEVSPDALTEMHVTEEKTDIVELLEAIAYLICQVSSRMAIL